MFGWYRNGQLNIRLGADARSAIGQLVSGTSMLAVRDNATAVPARVQPYEFRLDRWTRREIPVIHMHPFGLLHLMVSLQGPAPLLLYASIVGLQSGKNRLLIPVDKDCGLLRMLGVSGAMLSVTASDNLDVRARP
jgi:hypothetical protein